MEIPIPTIVLERQRDVLLDFGIGATEIGIHVDLNHTLIVAGK
jgi:hypothetical protein